MTSAAVPFPGDAARDRRLAEILRVDHAGEFGAVQIYRGQRAVFDMAPSKAHISGLLSEMEAGEQTHLETFDRLLVERGVRPTVFAPLWRIAGFTLGAATALMGEKAAHACTAAVEDVIEKHYAEQARALDDLDPELKATVEQFRADELHHKDTALAEGAAEAPGYKLMSAIIKFGCRAAIRISEKL
ncbi:MAG: demethoxyubiquinone hydroxylase family protein [Alphaproteobacteria bacterium]|jgi:ubiquinone biosynthesis monooxygenase Coq7|nr:demethoxyubiquinone hydroxylase family protein [Alphaproteobacteria bacterium]